MKIFDLFRFKKQELDPPMNRQDLFDRKNIKRVFDAFDMMIDPVTYFAKVPQRKNLRELYYDDEISSAIDTRQEACTSTPWTLEGGNDDVNEFIYENLSHHVKDIMDQAWWAIAYGYSVSQVVYEQDQGRVWWHTFYEEPFDQFKVSRDRKLYTIHRREELDPFKFILTVNKPSYYNPLGESVLAKLYFPFFFKCNGWDFWIKFLERWGSPFLHAKTDATDEQTRKALESLAQSKRPTGVVTGKDTDINAIEAGKGGEAFKAFTDAVNDRINKIVLGQTLTSGSGDTGSLALGQVHNEVRQDKKKADCDLLANTIQRCIDMLFYLNNFKGDVPQFIFEDPKGLQRDRADRDQVLKNIGVQFNEKYFIENYDIEPDHFKVVEPVSFGFSDDQFDYPNVSKKHTCFELSKDQQAQVRARDRLENDAMEQAGQVLSSEEIESIVKGAKTKKELESRLSYLIEKDSDQYDDSLTQLLFQTKLQGYVDGSGE